MLLRAAPDGTHAEPQARTDTAGAPRANVFPRSYRVDAYDEALGRPTTAAVPPPPIVAPQLSPAPTPTSTPTPTGPSPVATPTG